MIWTPGVASSCSETARPIAARSSEPCSGQRELSGSLAAWTCAVLAATSPANAVESPGIRLFHRAARTTLAARVALQHGQGVVSSSSPRCVVSAFWIWFYNFVPHAAAGSGAQRHYRRGRPMRRRSPFAQRWRSGPRGSPFPFVGVKAGQLIDTFDAGARQRRRHDAIDIMAAEGTPVIAAADGTIEKLFDSVRGGTTIYERSADQSGSIITPTSPLTRPASRRAAGEARPGRSGASAIRATPAPRLRTSISRSTDGARRALVARDADQSLSAACREKGPAARGCRGSFPTLSPKEKT